MRRICYKYQFVGVLACLISLNANGHASNIYLSKSNSSEFVILISPSSSNTEKKAAQILQTYFQKIAGVKYPITSELTDDNLNYLSIGKTEILSRKIIEKLKIGEYLQFNSPMRDAFIIEFDQNKSNVFLCGHQDQGTVFAVYHLLEQLGCRWFFACQAGEVIPRLDQIEIPKKNVFEVPSFSLRYHFSFNYSGNLEGEKEWREKNKMSDDWPKGWEGHNLNRIWPGKLYKEHPEYFPLIKGKRVLCGDGGFGQRCFSNPDMIKIGIDWAKRELKDNPEYDIISFIDGDAGRYCECGECHKIGNIADQRLYLANEIRKGIQDEFPQKMINIISYYKGAIVPTIRATGYTSNNDMIRAEVHSLFSPISFRALIEGWSKASHNIAIWDNVPDDRYYWNWGWGYEGKPISYIDHCRKEYSFYGKHVKENALQTKGDWARNGLSRYISAKMMWDVNADANVLKKDFCMKMFPSAVNTFYAFISLYEQQKDLNFVDFLGTGLYLLKKIKDTIQTEDEIFRWEFYALYLREQTLEYRLRKYKLGGANTAKKIKALSLSEKENVARILWDIIGLLKAVEKRGVFDSSQRIQEIYYLRLKALGENPGTNMCPEMPPVKLDSQKILEKFSADFHTYPRPTIIKITSIK